MSIATALTALADDVSAAKAAITAKGGTAPIGTSDMADAIAAIPSGGITPSGNIDITSMAQVDVTNYATAQIVDADLVASNIKKDVNILGVVGSFEGGGELHESGTVSFHLGSNNYYLKIPVSDMSYDNYLVKYKAKNSWKKVDGEWVEQDGLDFEGVESPVSMAMCGFGATSPIRPSAMIDVNGTARTSTNIFGIVCYSTVTGNFNFINSSAPTSAPSMSNNIITFNLGSNRYVSASNYGMTYEYEVWGWNDA